jgi:hypothetical protein
MPAFAPSPAMASFWTAWRRLNFNGEPGWREHGAGCARRANTWLSLMSRLFTLVMLTIAWPTPLRGRDRANPPTPRQTDFSKLENGLRRLGTDRCFP